MSLNFTSILETLRADAEQIRARITANNLLAYSPDISKESALKAKAAVEVYRAQHEAILHTMEALEALLSTGYPARPKHFVPQDTLDEFYVCLRTMGLALNDYATPVSVTLISSEETEV